MAAAWTVALASGSSDVTAHTGACKLMGFSIGESAAVAAATTVIIRDGTSTAGAVVAVIELEADKSETQFFGEGILMGTGVFVDRSVTGESQGAVYIA